MKKEIEKITSIALLSIDDDGPVDLKNKIVVPYLKFPRKLNERSFETEWGKDSEKKKRGLR